MIQAARQMRLKRQGKEWVSKSKMMRKQEKVETESCSTCGISHYGRHLGRANIFLSTFICGQLTQTTSVVCLCVWVNVCVHVCNARVDECIRLCACGKCHIKDWCTLPIMLWPVEQNRPTSQWTDRTDITWSDHTKFDCLCECVSVWMCECVSECVPFFGCQVLRLG